MKDKEISITAYQAKCEFCGEKFTEFEPHIAENKRNYHIDNDCRVLECLCIAKDIKYPIISGRQNDIPESD